MKDTVLLFRKIDFGLSIELWKFSVSFIVFYFYIKKEYERETESMGFPTQTQTHAYHLLCSKQAGTIILPTM